MFYFSCFNKHLSMHVSNYLGWYRELIIKTVTLISQLIRGKTINKDPCSVIIKLSKNGHEKTKTRVLEIVYNATNT